MAKTKNSSKQITARKLSAAILSRIDLKKTQADQIIQQLMPRTAQRQKATDLVYGTLRNRSAIDMVIAESAGCPAKRIPDRILNIIRIGGYELIYCPQTAEYAIVNEAVETAKTTGGKKQTAFVNAVLRKILSRIKQRKIELKNANPKSTLPQDTDFGCEFDIEFLPDPTKSPAEYFSNAFSLPFWLVEDWLNDFGLEKTRRICFASNRKPSIYIRVNTLQTSAEKLAEKLRADCLETQIIDDTILKIKSPKQLTALAGFCEGCFTIQDLTAAQAVKLLRPEQGWKILDLCAAPGTKTTQLAELTEDKAIIIATDINRKRLEKLEENIERLRLKSIRVIKYEDLQKVTDELNGFDAVILDVPCSNTAVLAKRPEARYRISKQAIKNLIKIQSQLLERAASLIFAGGILCYSTCSIQKEENQLQIQKFLQNNSSFSLEIEKLTLPKASELDFDGGYVAILKREP